MENRSHGISPLETKISSVVLSHFASRNLDWLDSNASSLINNIFAPEVTFEFPNEQMAKRILLDLVRNTIDVFWGKNSAQNPQEQKLIDDLRLLRGQGLDSKQTIEVLKFHLL